MKEEINPPFGKVTDEIFVNYCDGDENTGRTYGFTISDGTHSVDVDEIHLRFCNSNFSKPFLLLTGTNQHPHRWELTVKQTQTLLTEIARLLPRYGYEEDNICNSLKPSQNLSQEKKHDT